MRTGCVKSCVNESMIRRNCIIYRDSINARLAIGRVQFVHKENLYSSE